MHRRRRNQLYDDAGLLLVDRSDLCDCTDRACPGCHEPCPKCASPRCGGECRCLRPWVYSDVEVEGTGLTFRLNPASQAGP